MLLGLTHAKSNLWDLAGLEHCNSCCGVCSNGRKHLWDELVLQCGRNTSSKFAGICTSWHVTKQVGTVFALYRSRDMYMWLLSD